jgi:tetraprenyl-beta-curcumene synthase
MARQGMADGAGAATGALLSANARYWTTVLPDVRRELRRWDRRARAIPDPVLRAHALHKLRAERFNTEVAATLATIAPRTHRGVAVAAIVAVEVMYDYLDELTEQPVADPLANGRQLHRAFALALLPAVAAHDLYRHHPQQDDGGYLGALVACSRAAVWALPSAAAVVPAALAVAARCGEAQTRTHAVSQVGVGQLRSWARAEEGGDSLHWWEFAAGATASVLALHALIAAAAEPLTTPDDADRIARAYLTTCALTTLLDSLVDREPDAAAGSHAYLAYYGGDERRIAERLGRLARRAAAEVRGLPRAPHHLMTVAGAAAFYLSAPAAAGAEARRVTRPVVAELQPLITPTLALFELWRRAKLLRARRAHATDAWREVRARCQPSSSPSRPPQHSSSSARRASAR